MPVIIGTTGDDYLNGTTGNDHIQGLAGRDILNGRGGRDLMEGGSGNDSYFVDHSLTQVLESVGAGFDIVYASVDYALGAGQEIEVLSTASAAGTVTATLVGNEFNNNLVGNAGINYLRGGGGVDYLQGYGGNDWLDGGTGADIMEGGAGDDVYYVDHALDRPRESAGAGFDRVYAAVSYALPVGQEIEFLSTASAADTVTINLFGNEYNNNIVGNAGVNWLQGGGGADYLQAYEGNDRLDGGAGADILEGGTGNDIYYVDHGLDRPREKAGEGFDRVYATASYALTAGQEIELLSTASAAGTEAINLTGNEYNNNVIGNAGANWLGGGGGADYLQAYGGNDQLDGGTGADIMEGGLGNDTYFVDDALDRPRESAGEGFDRVLASTSYTLAAGQEIELLATTSTTGTAAINLTGNEFNNNVIGNAGVNTLNGGAGADFLEGHGGHDRLDGGIGADIMEGGAGNDTYYVDDALDRPRESAGNGLDTVFAGISYTLAAGQEIETLSTGNSAGLAAIDFTGNEFNNSLIGNNGVNVLNGGDGNDQLEGHGGADRLDGGAGRDVLVGGSGADVYRFGAVGHSAMGVNDVVNGFESGIDKIDLSAIDANALTAGSQSFNFIGSQAFSGQAGELRVIQTLATTFHLFGDTNGDGTADFHVQVNGNGLVAGDLTGIVVNRPPVISSGTAGSVAENGAVSTIVYQTVASDPDGDSLTYRLSGTDAALFTIDASGAVRLRAPANYEARSSYNVTVHADDGTGGTDSQAVTVAVQNVNEAPVITSGTTASIPENSPTSTIVYQAVATDPDGNALSYTLGGADAASFTIDSTGAVRFIQSPNFEARSSYSISVQASDGSLTALRGVNISVTDVSETVTSTPVLQETSAANDGIGSAQVIDRALLAVANNSNLQDRSLPSIQINGSVSVPGDQDFFSITLQAGELLILDVDGTATGGPTAPGLDSFLRAFEPGGRKITFNDDLVDFDPGSSSHSDASHNMDSLVSFRAPTTGTYTFSIGSFVGSDGQPTSSGSYILNVSVGPVATRAQIDQENIASLNSGVLWFNPGNLTFSFPVFDTQYPSGEGTDEKIDSFAPLTEPQRDVARTVFDFASELTQLGFSELTSSQGSAQIRLAQSDAAATAYAYYPGTGDGGDIWFRNHATDSDTGQSRFEDPVPGNYGYLTFIHEIGHALGLKHGHEVPSLSPDRNSMEYSVMTYSGYIYADLEDAGYTNETWGFAQSFMMYDIAALQQMYGVNWATNSGDTAYSWSPVTGAFSINGVVQWTPGGNRVFQTIWDGGGTDTYDLSSYANAVTIDLRPGEWTITSQVQLANLGGGNYARGNVANALQFSGDSRSLIENAIGGSGNDTLIANEAANRLTGGAGSDTFVWKSIGDAGDATGPDRILDFVTGSGEKIDLSAIDAITGTAANDAFTFIGANSFTGTAGELRFLVDSSGVNIYADTNGDAVADLHIIVNGTTIVASDFFF